jgi:hypothetical protein
MPANPADPIAQDILAQYLETTGPVSFEIFASSFAPTDSSLSAHRFPSQFKEIPDLHLMDLFNKVFRPSLFQHRSLDKDYPSLNSSSLLSTLKLRSVPTQLQSGPW